MRDGLRLRRFRMERSQPTNFPAPTAWRSRFPKAASRTSRSPSFGERNEQTASPCPLSIEISTHGLSRYVQVAFHGWNGMIAFQASGSRWLSRGCWELPLRLDLLIAGQPTACFMARDTGQTFRVVYLVNRCSQHRRLADAAQLTLNPPCAPTSEVTLTAQNRAELSFCGDKSSRISIGARRFSSSWATIAWYLSCSYPRRTEAEPSTCRSRSYQTIGALGIFWCSAVVSIFGSYACCCIVSMRCLMFL